MSEKNTQSWLTGEIFDGHFEVGHLIARGGMAEVYHGIDLWSNNPVAVKVLSPVLSTDPSQQQKFFREERSLRQISHKHVVGVVGSGTQKVQGQELMFIVLDYVHGSTLQQLLSLRPILSVQESLEIIIPAVEGLSEVHAHRFIHRDIKPSNILLSSVERSTKLTDFGLTRRTDQSWTGELMGTPAYVAPEIVDPQASVGPGVDIFAIGIVMFRMLAGRLPFSGMNDDQQIIYHNVNTEIPSLTQFAPGTDADLVGIVKWCTRKQASARPADATELFEVLQAIRQRLSFEELNYRADLADAPRTTLWEDVEHIAERTGATRLLERTSVSTFDSVENEIEDSDSLADEHSAPEFYEPKAISGVGPAPAPAYYSPQEDLWEEDFSPTITDHSDSGRFAPISASYRRKKSEENYPVQNTHTPANYQNEISTQVSRASGSSVRQAPQPWQQIPSAPTIILVIIGVLLSLTMAGFFGWLLAQSVLQSAWFTSWTEFLDGFKSA